MLCDIYEHDLIANADVVKLRNHKYVKLRNHKYTQVSYLDFN